MAAKLQELTRTSGGQIKGCSLSPQKSISGLYTHASKVGCVNAPVSGSTGMKCIIVFGGKKAMVK